MSAVLRRYYLALLIILLPLAAVRAQEEASCQTCHQEQARQFAESVHVSVKAGCRGCHGGAASYALPAGRPADSFDHGGSFVGKPSRFDIPEICAECHSNVALMNPYGLPANQLSRYRTSGHGQALYDRQNAAAAICTDCHDVHAIYKPSDPRSWTNPVNVPAMCGKCHENEALMAPHDHATEIMSEYRGSVHGRGLLQDGDMGMPTCATCHGNHAATPPGVDNVNAICGRCHMQSEQNFMHSPHATVPGFRRCVACHGGEYAHDIKRLTVRPEQLVAYYSRLRGTADDAQLIEKVHPGLSLIKEACSECHDEDSDDAGDLEAFKRSEQLYRAIGETELRFADQADRVNQAGRGVLLVEDEQLIMADAKTALIELGPTQHALNIEQIDELVEQLESSVNQVQASLADKQRGLAWRHQVLWPMWGFITVFAIASYIKYRRLKAALVKPLK